MVAPQTPSEERCLGHGQGVLALHCVTQTRRWRKRRHRWRRRPRRWRRWPCRWRRRACCCRMLTGRTAAAAEALVR
eukprot:1629967-Prymnesium_polylepis.2